LEKNIFIYLSLDCVCNAHRMGRLIWTWTIELVLHKENNILGLESKWEVTIWKSSRYPIAALVSAFNACKNLKSKIQIILCALQFAFHLNKQIFRDLRKDVMEIFINIEICSGQFYRVHLHERGHFFFPIFAMDMWQRLLELNLSPSLGTCLLLTIMDKSIAGNTEIDWSLW